MDKYSSKELVDFDLNDASEKEPFFKKSFLTKKDSLIHSKGLFTNNLIPKNELFYLVPQKNIFSYPLPKSIRLATNQFIFDDFINLINHSCDANSEFVIWPLKILLKSKRIIQPGEEITLDYFEFEEKNRLVDCKCGSEKCRKYFYIT
jgi:hypothetical protein